MAPATRPTGSAPLYASGAADGAYLAWQYLSGTTVPPVTGVSAVALHFTMPAMAGSFELRVFAANGYGRLATSSPIAVSSTAQITVNGAAPPAEVSVQPGDAIAVHVSGAPGNTTDWVAGWPQRGAAMRATWRGST